MTVRLLFNEAKATQTAARFLKLLNGKANYMKLIKLLYLVDREALLRWGRTVTTDRHVSMTYGVVLSRLHDLITEGPLPDSLGIWHEYISPPHGYEVTLQADAPADELSPAEEELIAEIATAHGWKTPWQLVDYIHSLPEWKDPKGGAIPLNYGEVLRAAGRNPEEAAAVEQELDTVAAVETLLHPV